MSVQKNQTDFTIIYNKYIVSYFLKAHCLFAIKKLITLYNDNNIM